MKDKLAPDIERDENGWIMFPRDTSMRKRLFPYTDPKDHIAKANMCMVEALVEYVSEPGEVILDPFAGTGTILCAVPLAREVVMVELEDSFYSAIELNIAGMKRLYPDINFEDMTTLIPADADAVLPVPETYDHAIFSPPYPMGLKKKGEMDKTSRDLGYESASDYSALPNNYTNYSEFIYHRKIKKFYGKVYESLKPGGTMTIIIKDHMQKGERIYKSERTLKDCKAVGFELGAWNKWLAMGGGYSAINRNAGLATVDDEDLLTFIKPV